LTEEEELSPCKKGKTSTLDTHTQKFMKQDLDPQERNILQLHSLQLDQQPPPQLFLIEAHPHQEEPLLAMDPHLDPPTSHHLPSDE